MSTVNEKLLEICTKSLTGLAICLGCDLQLFDTLAESASEQRPISLKDFAAKTNLRERYLKEWFGVMVCSDFVETDETGENFWLSKENAEAFSGEKKSALVLTMKLTLRFSEMYETIKSVFYKDGPLGTNYNDYKGLGEIIDVYSRGKMEKNFISDFIPLTGLKDRLENESLEVLDVGCGSGFHASLCAENFPKSSFTGIDISAEAIQLAVSHETKYNNLKFCLMDAKALPAEWNGRFDWITFFDAVHDQTRPDLALKCVYRALKDDGTLTIIDQDGTGNIFTDKKKFGKSAAFSYGWSLFGCLPCGSNEPDALCLGAMWGQSRALELLKCCGWTNVKVYPLTFTSENVLYVCKKH